MSLTVPESFRLFLEQTEAQVFKIFFTAVLERNREPKAFLAKCLALLVLATALGGCATVRPLPPIDLSASGWVTRSGQAVWVSGKEAPEIAGDLIVSTRPGGESFVQFTKTPLPFVTARTTSNTWQITFVPRNRTYSGHGAPPARLIWFALPRFVSGAPPAKPWQWQPQANGGWRLSNPATGESLEGYLAP